MKASVLQSRDTKLLWRFHIKKERLGSALRQPWKQSKLWPVLKRVSCSRLPQILCLAEQIQFTERCEAAIKSNSLQEFQIEMESQLESYTGTDIGGASPSDTESHVLELKLKALILDAIHAY